MAELKLTDIAKQYHSTRALYPTSFEVEPGEFIVVLGPSGCGKSTLMRILMGITEATGGEICLNGNRIDHLPPERRNVAMVLQSYALFPHMTVKGNISFGLKMKKIPRLERIRRISSAVEICNLGPYLDRYPRQLSGGQQQRIALARAIVLEPRLLLFDEPLSNLDAKLRETLRHDLVDLHRRTRATSLYVTHDQSEAMAMADRIIVMNEGRIVEIGTPVELYRAPKTAFTASFLGMTNLVAVNAVWSEGLLPWGQRVALSTPQTGPVQASIRPEALSITAAPAGPGRVVAKSFQGASTLYRVAIDNLELQTSSLGLDDAIQIGSAVNLTVTGPLHVVDPNPFGDS